MTTGNDNDLKRFLEGEHPVSHAYRRLPETAAPAHLDDAILSAAREEARRPVRPAWLLPMSVAATVVLGVGLSMRQVSLHSPALSDMTATRPSMEAASSPSARSARPGQSGRESTPVPKPSVEELLQTAPLEGVNMEEPSVDVESLRKRALAENTAFELPPLDAPEPPVRAGAQAIEADQATGYAPPPPAAIADTATATEDVADAVEDEARRARQKTLAYRTKELPLADEADAVFAELSTGEADGAIAGSLFAARIDNEQLNSLIEQRLDLIQTLHRDGEVDRAQRLFDELIESYPDYEIPEDFPLQPPAPEATQTTPP